MRRLFTLVVAMCAVACNHPSDEYSVYIDPAFGDKVGDVEEAVHQWQESVSEAGGSLTFHVIVEAKVCDDKCSHAITIHLATKTWIDGQPDSDNEAIGYASVRTTNDWRSVGDWSNLWVISDPAYNMSAVVAHELGHAMWLKHTPVSGALMYAEYRRAARNPTCNDLQQWAKLHGQSLVCQE